MKVTIIWVKAPHGDGWVPMEVVQTDYDQEIEYRLRERRRSGQTVSTSTHDVIVPADHPGVAYDCRSAAILAKELAETQKAATLDLAKTMQNAVDELSNRVTALESRQMPVIMADGRGQPEGITIGQIMEWHKEAIEEGRA